MGTWTIYTAGADVTLLNAILNGVAMICAQSGFVWGFAGLASLWRLVSTVTAGAMATGSQAGTVMTRGAFGVFLPLVMAMLLTFPGMQANVQVQSSLTGTTTTVANVPFVIAIIPAAGSLMASNVGGLTTTAFSNVNANYDLISASGNGFLDPLKRLLGARTAIQRLNGIDSEVKTIASACLGSDAAVDYASINQLVVNAGNTGATAAQTIAINGSDRTAIGALLFQAAQNPVGVVVDLNVNATSILSCTDAATFIQNDINNALTGPEFSRVVQGAINGMDQPSATAPYDINQFSTEYGALRGWSTVAGNLAGGQTQANSEAINFLFAETVTNTLNCLKASSSDKAACEAAMIQANEVERNNIQAAANEVPMLMYSGSFGNYILALIIGLGPVIVMFMMFAGVDAGKCIKTVVHIMVWPLLVTNVGAELVNAMISLQFTNYMASISQQGFLSLATMNSVYKELSLQVGTGSHVMASLPVLMSMIFALGETSALVSVANEIKPKGSEVGQAEAPSPTAAAPLTRQSSPVNITQGEGFGRVQAAGAFSSVAQSETYGSMHREASRSISDAETRQHTLTEGRNNLQDWQKAFQTGDYSKWDLSKSEGDSIKDSYDQSLRATHSNRVVDQASTNRQNTNSAEAGISGNAGISSKGISFGGGASGATKTGANDTMGRLKSGDSSDSADAAQALSHALSSDRANRLVQSHGGDRANTLRSSQGLAKSYQELTSKSDAHTDSVGEALKVSSGFVAATAKIGADEIAQNYRNNSDYAMFQKVEGRARDNDPSTKKYMDMARRDSAADLTDRVIGDEGASAAVLRTRAATLQYADPNASEQERFKALEFLNRGADAMTHIAIKPVGNADVHRDSPAIPDPVDRTGVDQRKFDAGNKAGAKPAGGNQGGAPHAPTHGKAHDHAPVPAAPVPGFARPAAPLDGGDIAKRAAGVAGKVGEYFHATDEAGLGEDGHGTVVRTAANVVDNAADTVRAKGVRSRFRFGKEPAVVQKEAQDKADLVPDINVDGP